MDGRASSHFKEPRWQSELFLPDSIVTTSGIPKDIYARI
jgi:hypothetical protein